MPKRCLFGAVPEGCRRSAINALDKLRDAGQNDPQSTARMSDFDSENKSRWEAALHTAFPQGIPQSASWTQRDAIVDALGPFCAKNLNHTMLPRGGGQDMDEVTYSREPGCIEFRPDPSVAYVCRPGVLYFENIAASPWNSFFLLDTASLSPSGVYEEGTRAHEEVLELPDGEYVNRSHLDEGSLGYDGNDRDIPIPDPHRLVVRILAGKLLIVAKRSLWNRVSQTYDGRHNTMSAAEIRAEIEAALRGP
jgi:hypothetical protein